jgi:hypothetical protein
VKLAVIPSRSIKLTAPKGLTVKRAATVREATELLLAAMKGGA